MRLRLSIVFILLCSSVSAQEKTGQQGSTTIKVQTIHGDIVKGNKITNNYYLKNPKITIYTNLLKRGLVLQGDTIFLDSTKFITILALAEIDFRFLPHPYFQLSFSYPVDSVAYQLGSRNGILGYHNIKTNLSPDKIIFTYVGGDLCTECFIRVRIKSKRPIDIKLTL
jgi:hypothetical protein